MKKKVFKKNEHEIETEILHWLNNIAGIFAFKVETRGFFDANKGFYRRNRSQYVLRGTSDIIAILKNGQFLAIEVKTPVNMKKFKNNPGEHEINQIAFLTKIREMNGISLCVSSLEEVMEYLVNPVSLDKEKHGFKHVNIH